MLPAIISFYEEEVVTQYFKGLPEELREKPPQQPRLVRTHKEKKCRFYALLVQSLGL